jgi:hypothetical protein
MNVRALLASVCLCACAFVLPPDAAANSDDDAEYSRGYAHCQGGGDNDSSYPESYQEGCDDAKMDRRSRLDDGTGQGSQSGRSLDPAIQACRQRSVEGSQYGIDDAQVLQLTQVGGDRYNIDIKSPAGNIRCVVSTEGEIFSADEI